LHLVRTISVAREQRLNRVVTEQLVLGQSEDLKRLLLGDKSALDPEAFLSHLFSTVVTELLTIIFPQFFFEVAMHTCHALIYGQRTDHMHAA